MNASRLDGTDSRKYSEGDVTFDDFKTQSPEYARVIEQGRLVAPSARPTLVRGETGCGKNFFVRALHNASPRAKRPFVEVNVAGAPETLYSTLFGHVRGAFTHALTDRVGAFQQADGGTIFLDEIGDLALDLQPLLLRACSQRTFVPLGGKEYTADVRIITATHRDLARMVREGTFREDLYHRLKELAIVLPPLRARREDVLPLLFRYLAAMGHPELARADAFEQEAWAYIASCPWPGNLRDLKAVAYRIATYAKGRKVRLEDVLLDDPPRYLDAPRPPAIEGATEIVALEEMKRRYVQYAYEVSGSNHCETARLLKVAVNTVKKYVGRRQGE